MGNTVVVNFKFNAPLHLNKERADMTDSDMTLHSDAMYAAIFYAWNMLGHPEFIPENNKDDIGFTISSLFPWLHNESGERIYFLPRPNFANASKEKIEDTAIRKKIKNAAWVDTAIFQKMLDGEKAGADKAGHINGQFRSSSSIAGTSGIESEVVTRAKVSRTGKENTEIFYTERYYFNNSGLYFILQYDDEEIKRKVTGALKYLGDEGIGTDRNTGNGKFDIETSSWGIDRNPGPKKYMVSLGLYCPGSDTELAAITGGGKLGVDLLKRGGWLSEPYIGLRKKSIYMFKEGSCFLLPENAANMVYPVMGAMYDIRPEKPGMSHPVWRCGKTMFVPF